MSLGNLAKIGSTCGAIRRVPVVGILPISHGARVTSLSTG